MRCLKRRLVIDSVVAACILVGIVLWFAYKPPPLEGPSRMPTQARLRLIAIMNALKMYEQEHGVLPFHPRGAAEALYLLKPYLADVGMTTVPRDARVFDCPYRAGRGKTPARWDGANRRLVGGDFDYLNRPPENAHPLDADIIIGAERRGIPGAGKYAIVRDGHVRWFSARQGEVPFSIVGRRESEFTNSIDVRGQRSWQGRSRVPEQER